MYTILLSLSAKKQLQKLDKKTPVALHTPLLTGLQAGGRMDPTEVKMSKSSPASMISIHDDKKTIENKLNKAFCPEKQVEGNPVLDICKHVIFPELCDKTFQIERPEKFGGDIEYGTFDELKNDFIGGLHPLDLKKTTAKYVNEILEPIRKYFEKHSENYSKMKNLKIIN